MGDHAAHPLPLRGLIDMASKKQPKKPMPKPAARGQQQPKPASRGAQKPMPGRGQQAGAAKDPKKAPKQDPKQQAKPAAKKPVPKKR